MTTLPHQTDCRDKGFSEGAKGGSTVGDGMSDGKYDRAQDKADGRIREDSMRRPADKLSGPATGKDRSSISCGQECVIKVLHYFLGKEEATITTPAHLGYYGASRTGSLLT